VHCLQAQRGGGAQRCAYTKRGTRASCTRRTVLPAPRAQVRLGPSLCGGSMATATGFSTCTRQAHTGHTELWGKAWRPAWVCGPIGIMQAGRATAIPFLNSNPLNSVPERAEMCMRARQCVVAACLTLCHYLRAHHGSWIMACTLRATLHLAVCIPSLSLSHASIHASTEGGLAGHGPTHLQAAGCGAGAG
jgi:hypothetical protein